MSAPDPETQSDPKDYPQPQTRSERWAVRLYARSLRLLPEEDRPFRLDALETFRDLVREKQRCNGQRAVLAATLRCCFGLLCLVAQDRLPSFERPFRRDSSTGPQRLPTEEASMLDTLLADLRFSLRSLSQRPAFALTVIGILAFGIGATTTVWSVVDSVLLRPLPYPEAERLVVFDKGAHPWRFYEALDETRSFDSLAGGWFGETVDLTGQGEPIQLDAAAVTPGFFELFGPQAQRGRLFADSDFVPKGRNVVISAGLWKRQWGEDPDLLGSSILLSGEPHTVIGILEADFRTPEALSRKQADIWQTLHVGDDPELMEWGLHVLDLVALLRPDVSIAAADAEVEALNVALAEAHDARRRRDGKHRSSPLLPLHQATVGQVSGHLWTLFGAVTFLLLIACVNVANLTLARGGERRREMALRSALGAGRRRLVRQLMVESSLLALAGGTLGVGLAVGGVALLDRLRPAGFPRYAEVAIDPRVMTFAVGLSLFTGILFGLFPALRASRTDLREALSEGAASTTASGSRLRARGILVVIEVALAVVLLFGAGLLFHSLIRMVSNEPGFEPDGLVRIGLELRGEEGDGEQEGPSFGTLVRRMLEATEAVPGVSATTASWILPFDYYGRSRCCWSSEVRLSDEVAPVDTYFHPITPDYFEVLGARLLRGRELEWADGLAPSEAGSDPIDPETAAGIPTPVVLNASFARDLAPDGEAVGLRLLKGDDPPRVLEVVGIVDDLRQYGYAAEPTNIIYLPYGRDGQMVPLLSLAIRTEIPFSPGLAADLRSALWSVAPEMPIPEISTFDNHMARSVAGPRFFTTLLGTFAVLSLLLAAAGLYGSLLYAVGQRSREMGIRMALGARGVDLQRLVVGQGLTLTALGLALGCVGALAAARVLESQIYGITTHDPTTLGGVAAILFAAAWIACWLPGRRAARTDPIITLRAE